MEKKTEFSIFFWRKFLRGRRPNRRVAFTRILWVERVERKRTANVPSEMSAFLRLALELLQNHLEPSGLRSLACSTLLRAFEAGVTAPAGAHLAAWRFLLASDASAVVLHRHEIPHEAVAREAIEVLTNRDSGENERDLALAVLRGPNVEFIEQDELVSIVDRVLDEGRARQVGWLVQRVHEERGLSLECLVSLRDRLASSSVAAVRTAAIEVGGLLPRLDLPFTLRMLADRSPVVRAAVADNLEQVDAPDQGSALKVVRDHLVSETHRSVVSACHYALGSLLQARGRRGDASPAVDEQH